MEDAVNLQLAPTYPTALDVPVILDTPVMVLTVQVRLLSFSATSLYTI